MRLAFLMLAMAFPAGCSQTQRWQEVARFTLPDIPLSTFLRDQFNLDSVTDHGIALGGVGSDIWHDPADGPDIFWMVSDRGPNAEIDVGGVIRRTFPVPEFVPFILKVRAQGGRLHIEQAIPLDGVTGLPNSLPRDERPYDCAAAVPLPLNPNGLDTEGIVRTTDGHFWLVEEYGPSIVKVDPMGKVVKRFEPPPIFGKRRVNRGFEGVTYSPDRQILYVALESPLSNPTSDVGNPSRNTRILAFDIASEMAVAEYVYRFQPSTEFSIPEVNTARPQDMKVSGLAMLDANRMLVIERTDFITKLYRVDVQPATNILGTSLDNSTSPLSLEGMNTDAALAAAGIIPLPKELIVTLDSTRPGIPRKIEGITILDATTVAFSNDNDFGIRSFETTTGCKLLENGIKSQVVVIRLDEPLK